MPKSKSRLLVKTSYSVKKNARTNTLAYFAEEGVMMENKLDNTDTWTSRADHCETDLGLKKIKIELQGCCQTLLQGIKD